MAVGDALDAVIDGQTSHLILNKEEREFLLRTKEILQKSRWVRHALGDINKNGKKIDIEWIAHNNSVLPDDTWEPNSCCFVGAMIVANDFKYLNNREKVVRTLASYIPIRRKQVSYLNYLGELEFFNDYDALRKRDVIRVIDHALREN